MKKLILSLILISTTVMNLCSQCEDREFYGSCTSIMVGKQASADGSTITSHTCDGRYRTWMDIVPAQKHKKGDVTKILKGTLFTESMDEIVKAQLADSKSQTEPHDFEITLEVKGEIPEEDETFAFLYTAYPCMNEKNLAIGETTIEGRKELENDKGMFYIEELQRIVLQRCTTARQAIQLMGQLVKKYGYADTGECLTFADKDEVWHFEIFGEGKDKIGGVWAAQRIPDDHVGVSANIPRIAEINLDDKDNFMASDNVFEVAKNMNFWDGKSTFKFWQAYSGKKPFSIREWFVLSSVAPSLKLSLQDEELPFSVKPEKPVSVRDVLKFFRSTYENTEYDMTKNLLIERKKKDSEEMETVKSDYANPWFSAQMVALVNAIKDSVIVRVRNIAVPQCSYAHVIQIRGWMPDEISCVAYFTNDNPAQSPRFPVYANILKTPKTLHVSGHKRFIADAASWIYRQANKLATIRWQESRKKLEKIRDDFEDKMFEEQNKIDSESMKILKEQGKQAFQEYLTEYLNGFAAETFDAWLKMRDELWYTLIRGL